MELTEDEIGKGGLGQKFKDNVTAIRLLKTLETEGRKATADAADIDPRPLPPFQRRRDEIAEQRDRQPQTDQAGNASGDPVEE
mgnify:CR=1 FL=1